MLEPLEPRLMLNGDSLRITEFMALNHDTFADGDGEFSDWVEIHNPTAAAVDLEGWFLTDDFGDLTKWPFPAVTIESGDYLVVFASDQPVDDYVDPAGYLHTTYALKGSGEYLGLIRPDGVTVEDAYQPTYPPQYDDVSYGLSPDFSTLGYFLAPTPEGPNVGEPVEDPTRLVVINEIMYHPFIGEPRADPPGTPYDESMNRNDREDYIELLNVGLEPVDLLGWQFSDGVDFTFPDVTLGAGEYLVVAADRDAFTAKYPEVTNVVGGWEGRLSNSGEDVELADERGRRVDQVHYYDEGDWAVREEGPLDNGHTGWIWSDATDGLGKSLELINSAMSNNNGQNWAASVPEGGTPGTPNSVAATDIAPMILDVAHFPAIPRSADPVTVTARVRDEVGTGVAATVYYRVDGDPSFSTVAMADDGLSGDGDAFDGVYGAVLPAQADGTVVEFYVHAVDAAAHERAWPAPTQPSGEQLTNLLYQVDDTFDPDTEWQPGSQPVYYLIMTEAERAELDLIGSQNPDAQSDAQMNATFIGATGTDTEVRYNIGIRNRGAGTRDNPPNNYRVNFPHDRPWKNITAININSKYTPLQLVGSTILRMAGLPAEDATAVQVRVNGSNLAETGVRMYGSYVSLQVYDGDLANKQFPDDSGGNLYKASHYPWTADLSYHQGDDPQDYIDDGYFKNTNSGENDWTDLINLTWWLNEGPDATYAEDVARVINVDQWLQWFAAQALIGNNETNLSTGAGDDYSMYRGVEDPRFLLLSHDLDSIFTHGAATDASIFRATGVDAIDRFLTHPAFVGRYYAQLKELIETAFSPEQINPLMDHALAGYVPQTYIDGLKQWVVDRNAYVLSVIPDSLSIDPTLPVVDGYYQSTTGVETLEGTAPAAETRSVLVGGQLADFSPVDGTWSIDTNPGTLVSDTLVASDHALTFHVPTAGEDVHAWTEAGFNDDDWVDSITVGAAGLVITEVGTGDTKFVEIENVAREALDTTGWSVLVNDASAPTPDVNAVNGVAWSLPASIAQGDVLYRTGDLGDNYWGSEILWEPEGPGWVMILDQGGNLVDFLAWGYSDTDIASLDVTFAPFANITVGNQFSGPGAEVGTVDVGDPVTQWVAFNDHFAGPGTHPNATTYAANDTVSGPLKDVSTGLGTGVTLTTSHSGVTFDNSSNPPAQGTDAYNVFNGYVDFTGGSGASLEIQAANNDNYTHAFSGLDTGDVVTYNFTGTSIRGNSNYIDRWTLVTLQGADSSVPAHSSGVGVVVVSPTAVAFMAGENNQPDQGYVAAWTDVDPGADGAFSIISTHYTGATPGVGTGTADGNKSYGLTGVRLEEMAPLGPLSWLKRTGDTDNDTAGDFARDDEASKGAENSEMTVPFGQVVPNALGVGFSDDQPQFDALIQTDVGEFMQDVNASGWTRMEFQVNDPSVYESLTLRMRYDDGFIAYLNGTEVARRNADDPITFDMTASDEHPNGQAVLFEDLDITDSLGALQSGTNVLAIHGLNLTASDADFLIQPELLAESGVPLTGLYVVPGINRITVQALDGEDGTGNELQRGFVDVWYDPAGPNNVIPGGDITVDTVLTVQDGPYHVTGDVVVLPGVTLTIDPGTTVFFDAGAGITVNGRLLAEGTEHRRIRLTRVPGATGDWDGLTFSNSLEDSRMTHLDMEYGDAGGESIYISRAQLLIDNMTWGDTEETAVEMRHPSLILRNSFIPGISNGEVIHGEYIEGNEYLILEGNVFDVCTGDDDVIDFLGADRPGPVFQVLNNVFLGGGDDGLDLDGTDAHIEGNVFMNFHLNTGRQTTANAIATGLPQSGESNRTEITVVRNVFFDNDHAILLKEDAFATVVNNVFVGTDLGLIQFYEMGGTAVHGPGRGAYLDGNILVDMAVPIFKNIDYDPENPDHVTELEMHRTLVPPQRAGDPVGARPETIMDLGVGNLAEDPRLADPAATTLQSLASLGAWNLLAQRDAFSNDFRLLPGSPALGAGPNGLDMGAMVPAGASISGEPPAVTNRTEATLTIGGPGITHFKFRVNNGAWSSEFPVETPVHLTGLSDGDYTIDAVGKNFAGVWQADADAAVSKTWTVDSSLAQIRINEVLALNTAVYQLEEPFSDLVELYNDGPAAVNLAGLSISDDANDPAKFVFPNDVPAETTIPAGGYLVLYADDETDEPGLHLGFALSGDGEGVFLYGTYDPVPQARPLLDSVEFGLQIPNVSIGRVGHESDWALTQPSFGAANVPARTGDLSTLQINEWLAAEEVLFNDDFVELYNPDPLPVALAGLHMTDDPYAAPGKHELAPLSFIAGSGYAALVADGDPEKGPHHVAFRLSAETEMLGLYDAELGEIDKMIYYPQTTDASEGRAPDGAEIYEFFMLPTPGVSNPAPTTTTVGLIAIDEVWAYDQSGGVPDPNWNQPGPDPAWPTGAAPLGVEDDPIPVSINTPLTLGDPQVMIYYFRTHFTLDVDPAYVVLEMTTLLDDGAVFYLNGEPAYRLGMDPDVRTVGDADFEGPYLIPTDALQQGDNVLAVEVHQCSSTSSDVVFGLRLDVQVTVPQDEQIAEAMALIGGLRITEMMYHPADDADTEFIELQNVGNTTLNLDGVRLAGGIAFTFPALMLPPDQYVVIVRDLEAFEREYGPGINVAGEYSGNLSNGGEDVTLKLAAPLEAAMLRFGYDDAWYPATDGGGYALEIRDPTAKPASWDKAESWQAGTIEGGTPGSADGQPLRDVLVNEVLSHTDYPPDLDAIELYNTTGQPIDLSGWFLSDSEENLRKFEIPADTIIPAGGYVVFDEADFNPNGEWNTEPDPRGENEFALDGAHGDDVWLVETDAEGHPIRVADHVEFPAAANGESFGRWPNGAGGLYPMTTPTLDKQHPEDGENSGPRLADVVLSEVHYNPTPLEDDDRLEFVEIYNSTHQTIELTNWRIRGGVDFDFAPGTTLDRYSTLVIVSFDPSDADALAAFNAAYGVDLVAGVDVVGGYSGQLGDAGEKVKLQRPDDPPPDEPDFIPHLLEDEVIYNNRDPWPVEADGGGDSLTRGEVDSWGNDYGSWAAVVPSPGTAWPPSWSEVVGRYIFYNNSRFDGNNPDANAQDDLAIAPDKQALLPVGQKATFANYTSYSRGINGIMIDVDRLPEGVELESDDFHFRVGNHDDWTTWEAAPALPTISVRQGEGVGGSDRVTLIWPDNVIQKQWLLVSLLATGDTMLRVDDLFFFGNAIGESGNSTIDAKVNAFDMLGARDNQRTFLNPAAIDFSFDFNRDARVNTYDMLIARDNQTHFLNALRLITPTAIMKVGGEDAAQVEQALAGDAGDAVFQQAAAHQAERPNTMPDGLAWLYQYEQTSTQRGSSGKDHSGRGAVDRVLMDYGL